MNYPQRLEDEITRWPDVSAHPHRFGGREFLLGKAEVGHVHVGGIVDIPFTRPIRDALIDEGLAEQHHWVPNSGWITFRIREETDFAHSVWLMRLSYLRYALKRDADAVRLLEEESKALRLNARFKGLFEILLNRRIARSERESNESTVSAT
jgi:Luciferase